jgi:hypothetical protein
MRMPPARSLPLATSSARGEVSNCHGVQNNLPLDGGGRREAPGGGDPERGDSLAIPLIIS